MQSIVALYQSLRQDFRAYMQHGYVSNRWIFLMVCAPFVGVWTGYAAHQGSQYLPPKARMEFLHETLPVGRNLLSEDFSEKELVWRQERIRRGETLSKSLQRLGVLDQDANTFARSSSVGCQLLRVPSGDLLQVAMDARGTLAAVRFLNDEQNGEKYFVTLRRDDKGVWQSQTSHVELERLENMRRMIIPNGKTSYRTLVRGGLPTIIAKQLEKIVSYRLPLEKLQAGDKLSVIYDSDYFQGALLEHGTVRAFEIIHKGKSYQAYYAEDQDQELGAYYNRQGHPWHKVKKYRNIMVPNARISSGFGTRRHPILKRVRMHTGLDFAAPTGSPVYAPSDGKVIRKSRSAGGYGQLLVLRHPDGMLTYYAHLSDFASGMKVGRRVRSGDLIAYVGSTGRSTGPHLHFELRTRKGRPIDPSAVALKPPLKMGRTKIIAGIKQYQPRLAVLARMPTQVAAQHRVSRDIS